MGQAYPISGLPTGAASAADLALKAAKASNLSDLASASTARTNLSLGTAALSAVGDFDAAGAAAATGVAYRFAGTGRWDMVPHGTSQLGVSAPAGTRSWIPFIVPKGGRSYDQIGINVTALGAGSIARLGLYSDSGGYPGSKVFDAGTVDTSSTGEKAATITQSPTEGLYWACVHVTGGGPLLTSVSGNLPDSMSVHFPNSAVATGTSQWKFGYQESGISAGSLPATAPAGMSVAGFLPIVGMRIAA